MKTVLITGATSGIGQQLALDYLKDDWQVIACGRNADKLASLKAQNPAHCQTLSFDVTDREAVLAAGQSLTQSLDLVILNAGTSLYIDDAKHFDSERFSRLMQTNLLGMAYCLEAFTRHIPAGGQLALVGSSAYLFPFTRAEAYGASKAAIAYLAQSLSLDLKAHQIDVSLITPGFVQTPLTDQNDFPMPMRIPVTRAVSDIRRGLAKRKKLISTPASFVFMLRLLNRFPYNLQLWLGQRMVRS
ncbi:SDR family NAD(P)-dependent oxidoreductase [Thiolinea disciformis]|uniref:SDR family NAD(P)-dependent oxidoreductase n=1 Tax=Thiolinea disciformis TaxID=125614 RepID=UPI0003606AAE|nr:SDR family NAD(P)-dependent oxidoreductase [Thiolinea disciformis]